MEDEELEDLASNPPEADETVTLSEIVVGRETVLLEEELWALCRECCLTLEFVHGTPELFQSLVITPDTVAFDRDGNVCFLDLDADPDPAYIPPEYEHDICTYKSELQAPESHLYSLGMTLLFAVECSGEGAQGESHGHGRAPLSEDLTDLLTHLTQADPESRPNLELVLEYCDRTLQDASSQEVCQQFACRSAAQGNSPKDEKRASLLSMTEELQSYLQTQSGLVAPAQHADGNNCSGPETGTSLSSSTHRHQQACSTETQTTSEQLQQSGLLSDDALKPRSSSVGLHHEFTVAADRVCSPRKSRRRPGLLLSELMDGLKRKLTEAELWSLCRECIISLQQKKKHLPAYISPDTVMIRDGGSVSFKAIPEDNPLEVIYMAPELQQKGVLNEKTCIYGLGVMLCCAAGQKEGNKEDLERTVGPALAELLATLTDSSPDVRPMLEVALMACDEFEKMTSVNSCEQCQALYTEVFSEMASGEVETTGLSIVDSNTGSSIATFTAQDSFLELATAGKKDLPDASFVQQTPVKRQLLVTEASTFQPAFTIAQKQVKVSGPPAGGGSAFKPVPTKARPTQRRQAGREEEEEDAEEEQFPSAFSSPATHFRPIVLQMPSTSKDRDHGDGAEEEGEKNVLRKLKEIKKSMLRHRSVGHVTKDEAEVHDSKPMAAATEKSRSPKLATSTSSSSSKSEGSDTVGSLEGFLQQLHSNGQMPDTQLLAKAIAQHLQSHLGLTQPQPQSTVQACIPVPQTVQLQPAGSTLATGIDSMTASDPPVTTQTAEKLYVDLQAVSAPVVSTDCQPLPVASGLQSPQQMVTGSVPFAAYGPTLPAVNLASVGASIYPSPMSLPILPFPGGVMPAVGGSVQYHLHQDPRTGVMQLVPIHMMSYTPPSIPSFSPHTPHSDPSYSPWQSGAVSPGAAFYHDFTFGSEDPPLQRHSVYSGVNSRSARGLIQKVAAQRAKNAASASTSPTESPNDIASNVFKCKSSSCVDDHAFYVSDPSLPHTSSTFHHRCSNSSGSGSLQKGKPIDDDAKHSLDDPAVSTSNRQCSQVLSNVRLDTSGHGSSSQSSSPSPSKDSGICLTQSASSGPPMEERQPASNASLMDRLLNSSNRRHQQAVTQVLLLLQQGFLLPASDQDGFLSEELLAEYIVSLAHLKWDTFRHAVTEKYSDVSWSPTLLVNLYHAVNDSPQFISAARSASLSPPAARSLSVFHGEVDDTLFIHDLPPRRSSEPGFADSIQNRSPANSNIVESTTPHTPMVHVFTNRHYVSGLSETSDSTDNEEHEKRRRFKKRYELDRSKNTSSHSLSGMAKFSLSPEQGFDSPVKNFQESPAASSLPSNQRLVQSNSEAVHRKARGDNHPDLNVNNENNFKLHSCELDFNTCSGYSDNLSVASPPSDYHGITKPLKPFQDHLPSTKPGHNARDTLERSVPGLNTSYAGFLGPSSNSKPSGSQAPRTPQAIVAQSQQQNLQPLNQGQLRHIRASSHGGQQLGLPRDFMPNLGPPLPSRTLSLNTSSGSNSHSPSFGQAGKEGDQAGTRPSRHSHSPSSLNSSSSNQSELPGSFVYGQQKEPLAKPSNTSPRIISPLLNIHASNPKSRGETTGCKRSPVQISASPALFPQAEVNNNDTRNVDKGASHFPHSKPSASRNGDRSPVRKTQHKIRPQLAWDQDIAEYCKKGQVVYHAAMIQLGITPEVDKFIHEIDADNKVAIGSRLASIEQEISMQRRQRRKSQAFYKKLTEPGTKQTKSESKVIVSQVLKDMSEMTSKLRYLSLCQTHLQMVLAGLYGLDICFLHTLVTSGEATLAGRDPQPLVLQPYQTNQLLQFQTVRDPMTGCEIRTLQAGYPPGLLAFLFTSFALSDGYIHQFLFCFRYFLKAEEVFAFITQKYIAASRGNQSDVNIVRTQQRAMDLLQYWVEGYYSVDFERNDSLLDRLETFVVQRVEQKIEGSQNLMNLLYACHLGENTELVSQADDNEDHDEVYYLYLAAPKRWESFKSLIGRKKSEGFPKPTSKKDGSSAAESVPYKANGGVLVEKRPPSRAEDAGSTNSLSRRMDSMQLMDYPPHRLTEQLTLMAQEIFQRTHPVHYLDSRVQGVGVDMSIPTLRTPSMARKGRTDGQSLFVGPRYFDSRVADMISHGQEITHWVSAEVLCCGSQKSQVSTLSKFLQTAELCVEIRNYATALAIKAGLDNLLVRQLSAWKHLPAKVATVIEDLETLQVKTKSEPLALMQEKDSYMYPTIPSILFFLLHVQQLEIGGFTLANGMFKWPKMRVITQMIDQIRIFREHEYGFEPNYELQSMIGRRLNELSDKDLHSLATIHDNSFQRLSYAAGIQGTLRKVKVKLQSRSK